MTRSSSTATSRHFLLEVNPQLPPMWTETLVSSRTPTHARSLARATASSKRGLRRQPALCDLQARFLAGFGRRTRRQERSAVSITDMLDDDNDAIIPCYPVHQRYEVSEAPEEEEEEAEFYSENGTPIPRSFYEKTVVDAAPEPHRVPGFPASWYTPARSKLNAAQIAQYRALGLGRPPLARAIFVPRSSTPTA